VTGGTTSPIACYTWEGVSGWNSAVRCGGGGRVVNRREAHVSLQDGQQRVDGLSLGEPVSQDTDRMSAPQIAHPGTLAAPTVRDASRPQDPKELVADVTGEEWARSPLAASTHCITTSSKNSQTIARQEPSPDNAGRSCTPQSPKPYNPDAPARHPAWTPLRVRQSFRHG